MSLLQRLASQSTILFGGRLFGAGLIFLAQAIIARVWGPTILGEFLVVNATVNLIAVAMPLGFQTIGSYFAAEYRARGDRKQFLSFLKRGYSHTAIAFVLLLVAGPWALGLIGQGGSVVAQHWAPVCMLALAAALVYVNGGVLIGLKRPMAGFFADALFRPILVLGSLLVCWMVFADPIEGFNTLLWAMAIGFVIISAVHTTVVFASIERVADDMPPSKSEWPRWWRFAAPWVLITLADDFFFDIDLLVLATQLDRDELAIFGVCTRIFSLVSFGVSAVYAVILPDMFDSHHQADPVAFEGKLAEANLAATGVSLALLVVVLIGAPFALMLFGPHFTDGALPLAILCLALVVRSAMGPASVVLSIHDRPWSSLPSVGLAVVTLVIGNIILVPMLHLIGAALAALIAITVWSVGLWLTALYMARIDVSILQWFRARRRQSAL